MLLVPGIAREENDNPQTVFLGQGMGGWIEYPSTLGMLVYVPKKHLMWFLRKFLIDFSWPGMVYIHCLNPAKYSAKASDIHCILKSFL